MEAFSFSSWAQITKTSPLPDTTELAWASATCKKVTQISLCMFTNTLEKWNFFSNCSSPYFFFFQTIPSQASIFLWHAYLDSIVTTEIMKSFVLRLSLHWCIPCSSLRSRPLNQVGRANSNAAQIISSFQEGLTFLSTLLPGKPTPHTFSCHVRWVAFSSVLPQHFVPDLYKLVFYLFACLSPP